MTTAALTRTDPGSYETDFFRWTQEQAAALRDARRAGTNLPLDWENLAEEIQSLGSQLRTELRRRLTTIIEHLLKLQLSPTAEPRAGWMATVDRSRAEVHDLLEDNPSLGTALPDAMERAQRTALTLTERALDRHGEATPAGIAALRSTTYSAEQILGDWFPEHSLGSEQ